MNASKTPWASILGISRARCGGVSWVDLHLRCCGALWVGMQWGRNMGVRSTVDDPEGDSKLDRDSAETLPDNEEAPSADPVTVLLMQGISRRTPGDDGRETMVSWVPAEGLPGSWELSQSEPAAHPSCSLVPLGTRKRQTAASRR
jgi:hypothetical protein